MEVFPSHKPPDHAYEQQNLFGLKIDNPLIEKLPEPIESSKFVPNKGRVSGDFDSRKDSHPKKFEPRDHTFMTSTLKRGGEGILKFATCLWILLFLNNRSIVHFCGWWGYGGGGSKNW